PPYSRKLKEAFIIKAFEESKKGNLCVMLLPVSTSTNIFHRIILSNAEIRFVKGRIKFEGINTMGKFVKNKCGMHDSMIVIFRNKN
ncbi:MAG TPA: DNA N-6-adenine-methyltransferase, partial [Candidatus Lokiarchaeia archaeon]